MNNFVREASRGVGLLSPHGVGRGFDFHFVLKQSIEYLDREPTSQEAHFI
jgi:hypothetical protein